MAAANGTKDEVYVNTEPNEQQDSTYDDPSQPTILSKKKCNDVGQDEVYVNPDKTDDEMYEEVEKKEPSGYKDQMYVLPTEMNDDYVINEITKTKPEDELYVNPELKNDEQSVYDDTTGLLDFDDRDYEKMKSGVSISDLNAEYVYAVKQDEKVLAENEVPDSERYENLRDNHKLKPSQGKTAENEYLALDRNSMLEAYCESQIYSSVQ